ncbi:erythrocyte membrane protein 1 [Plasmodium falciparum RAJ116]|uniref:Erythrocyte membrane protein 1 n=1 Tax=Plasmodium falciparum RAJ116 TaxID=580058 RepID=A0A0L0CYH9_PLAFA|nr:erythrocyte membrane protein 1 [Plasmodium falciparum RAJ116]
MFIEVVLEPLNRDTFNLSSGNTSTNKLTDNEWNQWKQDFIEQYLQNIQKDFILHDKWTIEHNEDLLDIPSSSHDDILKIKDETYNIISTNNLYSYENNDITPHQLGLPNIIPSGIIKHQNNGLRTNISMDIPFDEKNYNNVVTTSIIGDDQVENSYNL